MEPHYADSFIYNENSLDRFTFSGTLPCRQIYLQWIFVKRTALHKRKLTKQIYIQWNLTIGQIYLQWNLTVHIVLTTLQPKHKDTIIRSGASPQHCPQWNHHPNFLCKGTFSHSVFHSITWPHRFTHNGTPTHGKQFWQWNLRIQVLHSAMDLAIQTGLWVINRHDENSLTAIAMGRLQTGSIACYETSPWPHHADSVTRAKT